MGGEESEHRPAREEFALFRPGALLLNAFIRTRLSRWRPRNRDGR